MIAIYRHVIGELISQALSSLGPIFSGGSVLCCYNAFTIFVFAPIRNDKKMNKPNIVTL